MVGHDDCVLVWKASALHLMKRQPQALSPLRLLIVSGFCEGPAGSGARHACHTMVFLCHGESCADGTHNVMTGPLLPAARNVRAVDAF